MRRWILLFSLASVILLGAAGGIWLWAFYEPERPLEPAWDAVVTTIAGGGTFGSASADPFAVRFSDPFGIAATPDGTIFVADGVDAHRIVRLGGDGTVSVVAGSTAGFADGRGTDARFNTPSGIALDAAGTIYVADTGNNAIRRIAADRTVSTIAGPEAGLNGPIGVAVDPGGRVLVADTYNDRIVAIAPGGAITPLAGSDGPGFTDGANAAFHTPCGVAIDAAGNVYVADTGNDAVRVIDAGGIVSTVAVGWDAPLAVATAGDSVFVAGARGRILEIGPNREQRVVAGGGRGYADGAGASARFRSPSGIAAIAPGRLLVTDRRNGLIRLIAARSQMELRAPAPPIAPRFDAHDFDRSPLLWPFAPFEGPFEVTGTLGEPRGGDGSERFHAGLDVQAPEGTPVHVVRDASSDDPLATNAFNTLNESVRIGPVAYVHLRVGRDRRNRAIDDDRFVVSRDESGDVSGIRLKRGSHFAAGEVIGTVNRFYHAHVNVGWPGEELNPLLFRLTHFTDTIPPVIVNGGVQVIGEDGLPLTTRARRRLVIQGRVRVVVDAWDHVDGNLARRRLGLYRLGYQLLDARGIPMPGFEQPLERIRFDRHPDADAARVVYASGSGIPVYGNRRTRFLYVVTSTLRDGVATDGVFDTTTIAPGDYVLRILAADISGNEAMRNRDLPITITHRVIE